MNPTEKADQLIIDYFKITFPDYENPQVFLEKVYEQYYIIIENGQLFGLYPFVAYAINHVDGILDALSMATPLNCYNYWEDVKSELESYHKLKPIK